jgi:hypothetical protein
MNMGIQDAYNLAWKISLVKKGFGKEILLDSYEAERRPVAEATLRSTDVTTRGILAMLSIKSPLVLELRNHVFSLVTSLGIVRARAPRAVSMLDVSYPKSPIVAQDQPPIWSVRMMGDEDERPGLADWINFGEGPIPGARAPEVPLENGEGPERLYDVLRGTHHTLLLFDGASKTEEGYERFARIQAAVAARAGERVETHVIVIGKERPEELDSKISVLFDTEGELHRRFGARSECLYLVRPDAYVGYRCQPADEHRLAAYLDRIFV